MPNNTNTTITSHSKFSSGFEPEGIVQVGVTFTGDPIVTYSNEFKGRKYVHIRSVWLDKKGCWAPGKGISVPADEAPAMFAAIGAQAQPKAVAA